MADESPVPVTLETLASRLDQLSKSLEQKKKDDVPWWKVLVVLVPVGTFLFSGAQWAVDEAKHANELKVQGERYKAEQELGQRKRRDEQLQGIVDQYLGADDLHERSRVVAVLSAIPDGDGENRDRRKLLAGLANQLKVERGATEADVGEERVADAVLEQVRAEGVQLKAVTAGRLQHVQIGAGGCEGLVRWAKRLVSKGRSPTVYKHDRLDNGCVISIGAYPLDEANRVAEEWRKATPKHQALVTAGAGYGAKIFPEGQ